MNQLNADPKLIWKLHRYFQPHLKSWGEDYVLFDAVSGDIHILDQLNGYILQSLQSSPKTVEIISESISTEDGCSSSEIQALVSDALLELNLLRFVEEVKI